MLNVIEKERPEGIIVQFGGQTPLKLATALQKALVENPIPAASGESNGMWSGWLTLCGDAIAGAPTEFPRSSFSVLARPLSPQPNPGSRPQPWRCRQRQRVHLGHTARCH